MSLMGTLAKVAIGIAVAKGVGTMMAKAGQAGAAQGGGSGPFGGPHSPGGGVGGGLGDMMTEITGGQRRPGTATGGSGAGGGIGDLLEELGRHRDGAAETGAGRATLPGGTQQGGGIDDLLGQITGQPGGGGIGDLLGGLLGGLAGGAAGSAAGGAAQGRGGSFGDILNQSFGNRGEPDLAPSRAQDAAAGLMLRAMIQAAKSDGRIDAAEERKLLGNLGDISAEERRFVEAELRAPVDVAGLARQVPQGLGPQVYAMSVTAIDLDSRNEAQYLHQLAAAFGLEPAQVNQIHARLGVTPLYS